MSAETIDHAALVHLVEAGAVRSARVVGQAGGWVLMVRHGTRETALAAQRSRRVRVFKRMETLVTYLRGPGISRFDVDSALYSPETSGSRARPDSAEALRKAHQASAHDAWFKAQVQLALNEAEDPETPWIPNETAKISWSNKRDELATRVAAGAVD